jgi:NADP-dependent 3-hydroxy acid dehydrogenase YdfG
MRTIGHFQERDLDDATNGRDFAQLSASLQHPLLDRAGKSTFNLVHVRHKRLLSKPTVYNRHPPGGKATAVTTNVTDREQVKKLVDAAAQAYGRIDVIINNAGLMPQAPLERLQIDEWDRTIDVNIKGVLYGIAAAIISSIAHERRWHIGHLLQQ